MLYSYVVKKLVRESFENVNNHRYDELLKAVAPNVHHRFAGAHSIGGERHDKEAMRRWLERLGRVLPNLHIKVNDIWVKGGPWNTKVFVQWEATATLLNGDSSYFNRGLHVITMHMFVGSNRAVASGDGSGRELQTQRVLGHFSQPV